MGKNQRKYTFTEDELIEIQRGNMITCMAACLDYHEKLRQKEIREFPKRVLHNTKLLLRKYRSFKTMAEHAIYSPGQTEDEKMKQIMDLMSQRSEYDVRSIRKNAITTKTIMAHVDQALLEFRIDSEMYAKVGQNDWLRRYNVIDGLYIQFPPKTVSQIAEEQHINERTVFRDRDAACDKLSGYLWGIASLRDFLLVENVS